MRQLLFSILLVGVFFVPGIVDAQLVPSCQVGVGGTNECQMCHLVQLAQNVINFFVMIAALIAGLLIAVAGFKFVTAAGNSGEIQRAKTSITNVIIGFLIVLAAWIAVDTIIRLLTASGGFGPWNTITCTAQPRLISTGPGGVGALAVTNASGTVTNVIVGPAPGNCSPANLTALAQGSGYTMNQAMANTFSCLTVPESGCDNNADNPNSTARGILQVVRGINDQCHNLNVPACTAAAQAAGWTGTGNLNCSQAFSGGHAIPGHPMAAICDAAASDQTCNLHASLCLYQSGGFDHWTDPTNISGGAHTQQRACVAQYCPGNSC